MIKVGGKEVPIPHTWGEWKGLITDTPKRYKASVLWHMARLFYKEVSFARIHRAHNQIGDWYQLAQYFWEHATRQIKGDFLVYIYAVHNQMASFYERDDTTAESIKEQQQREENNNRIRENLGKPHRDPINGMMRKWEGGEYLYQIDGGWVPLSELPSENNEELARYRKQRERIDG